MKLAHVVVFGLAVTVALGQLYALETGATGPGTLLAEGFVYCPPAAGFNLVYNPPNPELVAGVNFWANDVVDGWDPVAPYNPPSATAGKWTPPTAATVKIRAQASKTGSGSYHSHTQVTGSFSCGSSPAPSVVAVPAGSVGIYVVEVGSTTLGEKLTAGFQYCPPAAGFNLVYNPPNPELVAGVNFWANEVVDGWDPVAPYNPPSATAGKWTPPTAATVKIRAQASKTGSGSYHHHIEITGSFTCDGAPASVVPDPSASLDPVASVSPAASLAPVASVSPAASVVAVPAGTPGLYVVEVGSTTLGQELTAGFQYCPPAAGFNLVYNPPNPELVAGVNFWANEVIDGWDPVAPFNPPSATAGQWTPPTAATVKIRAQASKKGSGSYHSHTEVTGSFTCSAPASVVPDPSASLDPVASVSPAASTPPTNAAVSLVVYEAGTTTPAKSAPLANNFVFCPTTIGTAITIECLAPTASTAKFTYAGTTRTEGVKPFIINGDNNGNAPAWPVPTGIVTIKCETNVGTVTLTGEFKCGTDPVVSPNPVVTPTPAVIDPSVPTEISSSYCITKKANTHTNTLAPNGWVPSAADPSALTYKPDEDNPAKTYPAGTDPLTFTFTPALTSKYAVSMTSTTGAVTDYNDVWFKFTPGLTFRKIVSDVTQPLSSTKTGFVKAYQNNGAKATIAWSVDEDFHSIETTGLLNAGQEYTFTIAARSPQFTLHGLVMYPCKGDECWPIGQFGSNYRWTCRA